MNSKTHALQYVWRIIYAHMIAYFIAGLFALLVVNYKALYATASLALIMKPVTEPIVALGPFLQLFRGILIAIGILPLKDVFFHQNYGYFKLGLLLLIFSLFSTIGPTMGSFDGYIYTTIPPMSQFLGYPEAFLYIFLFVLLLKAANKYTHNKIATIVPIVCVCIIAFMSIMGYFFA